jgi:hypothetical protein
MGCFSVFLCDAQARARMYSPDSELELGMGLNGSSGWNMLTRYAAVKPVLFNTRFMDQRGSHAVQFHNGKLKGERN